MAASVPNGTYKIDVAAKGGTSGYTPSEKPYNVIISCSAAAPVVSAGPDVSGSEGSAISLAGGVTDADSKATAQWSYAAGPGVDAGASCSFADASAASTTITCTDDGSYSVTLTGDDLTNPAVSDTAVVTVGNVAPSVTISAPASGTVFPAASAVSVAASYTDAGANDTHTCSINWGDGTTTAGTVNASATPRTCTGSKTTPLLAPTQFK